MSLRSLKAKGEPLLKKAYGEEGGDDIDYDRRLLTSSDESVSEVILPFFFFSIVKQVITYQHLSLIHSSLIVRL